MLDATAAWAGALLVGLILLIFLASGLASDQPWISLCGPAAWSLCRYKGMEGVFASTHASACVLASKSGFSMSQSAQACMEARSTSYADDMQGPASPAAGQGGADKAPSGRSKGRSPEYSVPMPSAVDLAAVVNTQLGKLMMGARHGTLLTACHWTLVAEPLLAWTARCSQYQYFDGQCCHMHSLLPASSHTCMCTCTTTR